MSIIKKSYRELQKFDNLATEWLIRNGYFEVDPQTKKGKFTEKVTKEPTKLMTNMKNVIKQFQKAFENYQEKISEIQIDFCSVDEKTKVILYNSNGTYQFTKENMKACNKKLKELADEKIDVHQRITEGTWELTDDEKEAFSGILIPELDHVDS